MPLGLPPVVALLLGLVHCLAGYRLFMVVLGAYGLALGLGAGSALAHTWFPGHELATSLMQIGGALLGLGVVLAFYRTAVFLIGAVASFLLTQAAGPLLGGDVTWQVQLLLALVAGSAAVVVQRAIIIAATAVTGAALVVSSAWALAESPVLWVARTHLPPWTGVVPGAGVELVAWAVLTALGIAIQQATTRR